MMFQVYVVLFINKSTKDRVLLDPDSIRTSLSSLLSIRLLLKVSRFRSMQINLMEFGDNALAQDVGADLEAFAGGVAHKTMSTRQRK